MPQILRAIAVFLFLTLNSTLFATQFKSTESFTLSSTNQIADDLIITGKNVKIDGEVLGDLITFCRSNSIKGRVENSAFNFSRYLDVSGQIEGSLTSFSEDISVSGKIGRNLSTFCATLSLTREAVIEEQVNAFAGEVDIEGEVKKGAFIHAKEVIISGHIAGNVKIEAERLVIMEGAIIEGDLKYESAIEAKVDPHARITGEVKWTEKIRKRGAYRHFGFLNVGLFVGNLAMGAVLIALFRRRWDSSQKAITRSFLNLLASLGLGFVLAVSMPVAALILIFTVIGIPLSLLIMVCWFLVFYVAKLIFSAALGNWLYRIFRKDKDASIMWAFVIGYVVFWLLSGFRIPGVKSSIVHNAPFLIIYFVAFFVGFGGMVLGNRENGKPAPVTTSVTPTVAS